MNFSKLLLTASISASALTMMMTSNADACGGFFCNNQPVIQTGERRFYGCFALRKGVIAPEEE